MQRRPLIALVAAVLIALATALAGMRSTGGGASRPGGGAAYRAHVERVVDGDTLIVRRSSGGDRLRVRVIGVDTPEDVKPDTPVECWSLRAAAFTRATLEGRDVLLTPGREPYDRYGRTLAYVERDDGIELETALLRGGYARTLAIAPNTDRAARYAALERTARRAGTGLWGACPDAARWAGEG